MIRVHRDPLGIQLFDVRYHSATHTFLSHEEAARFLDAEADQQERLRAVAAIKPSKIKIGKPMKPQRMVWTERRGNSGN